MLEIRNVRSSVTAEMFTSLCQIVSLFIWKALKLIEFTRILSILVNKSLSFSHWTIKRLFNFVLKLVCDLLTERKLQTYSMAANPPEENFDQAELYDEDDLGEVQIEASTGRKRLFSKELRCMMYGFGDDQNPYTESVDLLEDLVIEFITEMTHRAMEIGRTGRVQVEDIIFLVRKDARKYSRVKDLLTMNEELKRARKAFDEIKYVGAEAKIK